LHAQPAFLGKGNKAMGYHPLPLQEISPIVRRGVALSKRQSRQIWVVWNGRKIVLREAFKAGHGTLMARIIGDEIFPCKEH
jgi:hypothetical protein